MAISNPTITARQKELANLMSLKPESRVKVSWVQLLGTAEAGIFTDWGSDFQKNLKTCTKIFLRCVLSSSYDIDLRSVKIILRYS